MGASPFTTTATGTTAAHAFHAAQEEAFWHHGHGGYTGTIAEKDRFLEFTPRNGTGANLVAALEASDGVPSPELVQALGRADADWAFAIYDDKWGPAVAVKTSSTEWTFCGWAST